MVDLGGLAVLADLGGLALLLGGLLLVERPAAADPGINRAGTEPNFSRIDATCGPLARHGIDADHFGHVGARELRAETTARPGGIPQAEHQRGRAQFEQGGGIAQVDVVDLAAMRGLAELHPVQQAVAQQRIGNAVRRFQAGHAQVTAQILSGEIDGDHRQRNLLVIPRVE
jgi:hypothetical protein